MGTEAQRRENFLRSPDHGVEVVERPGGSMFNPGDSQCRGLRRVFMIAVSLLGVGSLESQELPGAPSD